MVRFTEGGGVGIKNEFGTTIVQPFYGKLGWSDGSFFFQGGVTGYFLNDRWGLISMDGKIVTDPLYHSLIPSGAYFIATKSISAIAEKSGCLDSQGRVLIPFSYDRIWMHGDFGMVMNKVGPNYRFGLVTNKNKELVACTWKNIRPVAKGVFLIENNMGKSALFDTSVGKLKEFRLDSISGFDGSYARVYSDGYQGLISSEGKQVLPPVYRKVSVDRYGFVKGEKFNQWKIISPSNQEIRSFDADYVEPFGKGLWKLGRGPVAQVVNDNMEPVWKIMVNSIGAEKDGLLLASSGGKKGLVNPGGKWVIPALYDSLIYFGPWAAVSERTGGSENWFLINPFTGFKSEKSYHHIRPAFGGFVVGKNRLQGWLDDQGAERLALIFDSVLVIRSNQASVKFMGRYGIISTNMQWSLLPGTEPAEPVDDSRYLVQQSGMFKLRTYSGDLIWFSENKTTVKDQYLEELLPNGGNRKVTFSGTFEEPSEQHLKEVRSYEPSFKATEGLKGFFSDDKFGFRDEQGRIIIPNRYDSIEVFGDGLAAVKLLGKWGFINRQDKLIIQPILTYPTVFSHGVAVVNFNGKSGIINQNGEWNLKPEYDRLTPTEDGKYFLTQKGRFVGLADLNGKVLLETRFETIIPAGKDLVIVKDNRWGVLSASGLSVIPITYKSVTHLKGTGNFLCLVETP